MLELSNVSDGKSAWKEARLQFHDTFCALGRLTSLHLSNVDHMVHMDVLPGEDYGSLTNLRYIQKHLDE
jgi:hypothetical protein